MEIDRKRYEMIRSLLLKYEAGLGFDDDGFAIYYSDDFEGWYTSEEREIIPLMSLATTGRNSSEALCRKLNEARVTRDELVASVLMHIQEEAPQKEEPYKREVAITSKEEGCVLAHLQVDFNEKTFEADFDEDAVDVAYAEKFKFKPVAVDE